MEKCSHRNSLFSGRIFLRISLIIFLLNTSIAHCQNWQPVGKGFDHDVRCLYADNLNNILYAGGNFKSSDSLKVRGIAQWNGINWDSLQSGIDDFHSGDPNPVFSICGYQNRIFVGGSFSTAGGLSSPYLGIWDGLQWDSLPFQINGSIDFLSQIDSELYFGGTFSSAGGIQSSHIAKWNGANCSGFNFGIDSSFGAVFSILEENGNLFVGGNILPAAIRDLFIWNGSVVSQVGNGIQGSLAYVSSMVIFNNELYVAGNFKVSNGNAGENIMRWNGINWSGVGAGLSDYVLSLKVHNGFLYAAGIFDHAGGVPASRIARWDGVSWSALGTEIFDNVIGCIEFFNNELYVGGGFLHVDTLTLNKIAKYTGPLTLGDFSKPSLNFYLTPNPSNSFINISFLSPLLEDAILSTTDATGKKQFQVFIPKQTAKKEIDISELAQGIYFLTLQTLNGTTTRKLVKQ